MTWTPYVRPRMVQILPGHTKRTDLTRLTWHVHAVPGGDKTACGKAFDPQRIFVRDVSQVVTADGAIGHTAPAGLDVCASCSAASGVSVVDVDDAPTKPEGDQ